MANATADIALGGIGQDGTRFHWPVKTAQAIYTGTMVSQQTSDGLIVPATASGAGRVIGKALQTIASAAAAERCLIETDRVFRLTNGSGANAFSEASPRGAPAYAFDDHTVYDNSVGDTLKLAGFFEGMEADGKVRVRIVGPDLTGALSDVGEASAFSGHGVRGASTANIAALATFTVAGVDGLTYVAGERILLKDQTAPAENGIYVVGTVAAGTAPLTRALDADGADEIVSGMLVHVSEGTVALNSWWALTTNAAIAIGTTSLTFAQIPTHANLAATAGAGLIGVLDTAALFTGTTVETALAEAGHPNEVRYVMTTDVANLASFTVAQDGVTGVEGDLVLLANQTTAAQNGVYSLGTVAAGAAPLTRATWLTTGKVVNGGYTVHVNSGTLNAFSSWFIGTAGAITIGTTAHAWYPESITQSLAFPVNTGYIAVTNVPILSATKTMLNVINIAEVTADLTVRYSRRPGTVAAGVVGTATIEVMAEIAAGGVNVDDDSTLLVQIVNR